jgi:hypothetical protein
MLFWYIVGHSAAYPRQILHIERKPITQLYLKGNNISKGGGYVNALIKKEGNWGEIIERSKTSVRTNLILV